MIEPGLTRSELFNFAYEQQKIIDRLRAENAELISILRDATIIRGLQRQLDWKQRHGDSSAEYATDIIGIENNLNMIDAKIRAAIAKAEKGE